MTLREYKDVVLADLGRINGERNASALCKELLYGEGFAYLFWLRTCHYLSQCNWNWLGPLVIARLFLRHYKYKLGISIPVSTQIGRGLYIGHFGGIVVNGKATIGKNCNLSHGVTIGQLNRGRRRGCPAIGNNVFIGPGSMIFGAITVGNNVAIGANSTILDDVPDNAVVAGSPGKIINFEGSTGYVVHTTD